MKRIRVTTTKDNGYTVYSFSMNNIEHDLMTTDFNEYTLWHFPHENKKAGEREVFDSLTDLSNKYKSLRKLAVKLSKEVEDIPVLSAAVKPAFKLEYL